MGGNISSAICFQPYRSRFFFILYTLIVGTSIIAQNIKRPDSYNYQRGVEAIQNENPQEALEYLNKDISENPKNGYSFSWIAMLRLQNEEYGKALTAADLAIKYLPKKDVEYVIFAYSTRANVYLNLEDTVKALSDYTTSNLIKVACMTNVPKYISNKVSLSCQMPIIAR